MSRDPFFDAIRDQLLPDATDTEIESLFGQYLGAQPEPVFIAHIAGDPKPQGSKRYVTRQCWCKRFSACPALKASAACSPRLNPHTTSTNYAGR